MKKKTLILLLVTILIAAATFPLMACTGKGGNKPTPTPTATPVPDGEDGYAYNGMTYYGDYDLDCDGVSDKLEVKVYGTNPRDKDTDGDGINDYNEIFIYPDYLDPLNASDAQPFIDMLPNVMANYTDWVNGGTSNNNCKRIVDISLNDPLVKWYADHTSIVWSGTSGQLKINGERFFQEYTWYAVPVGCLMTPAYYFTSGRNGDCINVAEALYVVMKLKGYQCVIVTGMVGDWGHAWTEVKIEGTIYVLEYNVVVPADEFYTAHPDWVIEKRYTEENPYIDIGPMK